MLRIRGDRLIVKMPKMETKTDTGLHIPVIAEEPPMEGIVLQVGEEVTQDVNPGDRVIFEQWAGLEHEDPDYGNVLILQEKELMALVEKDA